MITRRYILLFAVVWLFSNCAEHSKKDTHEAQFTYQAVEFLVFDVEPTLVEDFIKLDHEIWTRQLKKYPGFIAKEHWVNESNRREVTTIVYWNSYQEWKSIPQEELKATEKKFNEAFGEENYALIGEYHKENKWFKIQEYILPRKEKD